MKKKMLPLFMALSLLVPNTAYAGTHTVNSWQEYKNAVMEDIKKQETGIVINFDNTTKFKTEAEIAKKLGDLYLEAENAVGGFYGQNRYSLSFNNSKYKRDNKGNLYFYTGNYTVTYKNSREDIKELDRVVDLILKDIIKTDMTDAQKLRAVYTFVVDSFIYKKLSKDDNDIENILKERNILLGLRGQGVVCEAYAMLFEKMATKLGIENKLVTGTGSDGVAHIWNIVKLDGYWYNVDATAGDTEIHELVAIYRNKYKSQYSEKEYLEIAKKEMARVRSMYLLTSDEALEKTHFWQKDKFTKAERIYAF